MVASVFLVAVVAGIILGVKSWARRLIRRRARRRR